MRASIVILYTKQNTERWIESGHMRTRAFPWNSPRTICSHTNHDVVQSVRLELTALIIRLLLWAMTDSVLYRSTVYISTQSSVAQHNTRTFPDNSNTIFVAFSIWWAATNSPDYSEGYGVLKAKPTEVYSSCTFVNSPTNLSKAQILRWTWSCQASF